MKRLLVFTLWAAMAPVLMAEATFCAATYNIRTDVSSDTGYLSWPNRRADVFDVIRSNGFDVFGLNEVRFGGQLRDVTGEFAGEFGFSYWDGTGAGFDVDNRTNTDMVCYRLSMFDLVDEGWFFLGPQTAEWNNPWDNSSQENARVAVWVRLRAKATGEEFYFMSTHLDHKGSYARAFQAQRLVDLSWQLAGSTPIIVCGDMNATTTRKNVYNLLRAHFDDAFLMVDSYGLDYESTSGKWDGDVTDGSRIDYIFSRYMTVNSYRHIADKYDDAFPPSDHYPVMANVTIANPAMHTFCVDPAAGSDTNAGTPDAPFATLKQAVAAASRGDSILVAAGRATLSAPLKINKSLRLYGGYNADFSAATGKTVLVAEGANRLITINSTLAVEIHRFGFAAASIEGDDQDGGAVMSKAMTLTLRDCDFSHCHAGRNGGGLYCANQLHMERCAFNGCSAEGSGGAFCCGEESKLYWYNYTLRGNYFVGNTAPEASVGYIPRFIHLWIADNTFERNTAAEGSTLVLTAHHNATLGSRLYVFNNTFAGNTAAKASALYTDLEFGAPASLAFNTVMGNTSTDGVGAIHLYSAEPCVWNNIIACNPGGDLRINSESLTMANNLVTTPDACVPRASSSNLAAASAEECAGLLAEIFQGCVADDGAFVPELAMPADLKPYELGGLFYTGTYGVPVAPVAEPLKPEFGTDATLRRVTAQRMLETTLNADFDYDGQQLNSLTYDQSGAPRPTDGTATIGAVECAVLSGLDTAHAATATPSQAIYDLQGRRVANPSLPGLYLVGGRLTHLK